MIDDLDPAHILAAARRHGFSRSGEIRVVETTGSTSDDARAAAQRGALAGSLFVADTQERGRGRRARSWSAPPGSGILASLVLRPSMDASRLPPLALVVGLAIRDVIDACLAAEASDNVAREARSRVTIKWPNDVLVDAKKCSGILVEATIQGSTPTSVIVGFGINVRASSLPPEVASRATSLEAAGAATSRLDRAEILGHAIAVIDARVTRFERAGLASLIDELRAHDGARGRSVMIDGEPGVADGIADDGSLIVLTERGVIHAHGADFVDAGQNTMTAPAQV
jgi:BirA family biotin operon repressor/biotin-[acetyl-CoA-carboxylase] ligase